MNPFNSLLNMIDTLRTEDECREYLEELIWHGHLKCSYCSCTEEQWKLTIFGRFRGMYKCLHETVAHHLDEYVNKNGYHTNSIEGSWSLLKRGIIGIFTA